MIDIKNLHVSFSSRPILKGINLSFDSNGLYFIVGDSGCGKTTLLNCLSGLINYDGEISYKHKNISSFNESKKDEFRLKHIGFVFQDFRLFINDTALENVTFPLESISNSKKAYIKRKGLDLLQTLGILDKKDEKVTNLSGGQKQRVAIARALVNDPKILLCDEPTGALDSKTSIEIIEILKQLAKNHLVIIVTHDLELAQNYGDKIISMKDGEIIEEKECQNKSSDKTIAIFKNEFKEKKTDLPSSFIFRHTINSIKNRKFRTFFTNIIASLGIAGIGMSFVLSDLIKSNIMQVYSSIIEDNQLLVTSNIKRDDTISMIGSTFEDCLVIANRYKEDISGVGICYKAPFETFFPDQNDFSFIARNYKYQIHSYSIRNINEFVWMEDLKDYVYPFTPSSLEDDEIIMSLSIFEVKQLCEALRIDKKVEALSAYIDNHDIKLCLSLSNINWGYEDEQIFTLKGFTLSNVPTIYHYNPLWNQTVLEHQMRFPINSNFSQADKMPWVLKKVPYLKVKDFNSNFYQDIFEKDDLSEFIFSLANSKFYPWLYSESSPKEIDRLLVFQKTIDTCSSQDWKYFKTFTDKIKNPIFSTQSGYAIYGAAMLVGFAKSTYFAANLDYLNGFLEKYDDIQLESNETLEMPKGVLKGHFSSTSLDNVIIKGINQKRIKGTPPNKLNEVVVSSHLAKELFDTEKVEGKTLHLASLKETFIQEDGSTISSFLNDDLTITGVIDEKKNAIFQDEYWSLAYFQSHLGVSGYELLVSSFTFELNDKSDQANVIKTLNKEFPQYSVINPLKDISDGLDDICYYLEIALSALSIVAIIISLFLITINDYLHIKEKERDIGIIRCIGIDKNKASKYLYYHSVILSLIAYLTACVELFAFSIVGSFILSDYMGVPFTFEFHIWPYIIMLALSLICGYLPALIINFKMKKLNPIEAMKG